MTITDNRQISVLQALLSADSKPKRDVPMKRLGVDFQIQALDGKTIHKIQEQCTHYTGKGAKREKVLDEEQFGALVIQRACLIPDWSARELIDKYGSPTEAILGVLLAGEIAKLSSEILEISGFDSDEDEIKN
ncbi:phage tail assembly chaperone [Paenibacillus cellulositrophicus]|uniref:phage tail assembly chaperone n=1 Tax=Paenibacillus cellulositrophicus TaxID=562959 RepID=UPI003D9995C0